MEDSQFTGDDLPPALPLKQRRSFYSGGSSSSCADQGSVVTPSPQPSSQRPASVSLPASSSPDDCFAPQCPIHHRYGSHQERYFSDKTPPPIPKKRLARTVSLPEGFPGSSPFSSSSSSRPVPLSPFGHTLCGLSPLEDAVFDPDCGAGDTPEDEAPPSQPVDQLHFDTPDQQLVCFLADLVEPQHLAEDLQGRLLVFMRGAAERMEWAVGRGGRQVMEQGIPPQDLMLLGTDDWFPASHGRILYGRATCLSLQEKEFSFMASPETDALIPTGPDEPHANIQKVLSHFQGGTTSEYTSVHDRGRSNAWPPGGAREPETPQEGPAGDELPSVLSLLRQGYGVTVSSDVTHGSVEEFVQEGRSLHWHHPDLYQRRILLLLLQVAQALRYLKTYDIQVTSLDPRTVRLAWPDASRLQAKAKSRDGDVKGAGVCGAESSVEGKHNPKTQAQDSSGTLWDLWTERGAPRALVTSCPSAKCHGPITSHQVQLGLLLQQCLHLSVGQVSSTDALPSSAYSRRLQLLISLLLAPDNKLQMADTIPLFQALVWGPRPELLHDGLRAPASTVVVKHWLVVKRTLLLLKLAERGLFSDQLAGGWEDYLCLQYFGLADPHSVLNAVLKLEGSIAQP